MNTGQLQRIYRDKREVELKNWDLEAKLETKIDGTGATDLDFKQKMDQMEQERIQDLQNKKDFDQDYMLKLDELFKKEEKSASD